MDETKLDLGAMQRAVETCNKNIKVFEDAIEKERATKREYQRIVGVLQEQFRQKAERTITVEAGRGNNR